MTNPTPTSGAADLPEALRLANELDHGYPLVEDAQAAATELRRLHALTAQAISAEPAGAGYAELPDLTSDSPLWEAIGRHRRAGFAVDTTQAAMAVDAVVQDMLRDFADRTHALRASHGQAPAAQPAPTWDALHYAWRKVGADAVADCGAFTHAVHYAPQATPSPQAADTGEAQGAAVLVYENEKWKEDFIRACHLADRLDRSTLAAAPNTPQAAQGAGITAVGGMVSVCKEDANRYCEILAMLGMEEEGDPVAEVQRLQDRAAHAIWSIWEALPGYLIDNCEGTPVSEEMLQHALSKMLADPQYKAPDWAAAPQPAPPADSVLEDAHALLQDVAACFTRDDDLPDNLLPRIDSVLAARKQGGSHD